MIEQTQQEITSRKVRRSVIATPSFWIAIVVVNVVFVSWIYATVHRKIDYEAFYCAGRAFLVNPQHVYDPMVQLKAGGIWQTEDDLLPFYHLPNELIIFAPLSLLSYDNSLLLWRLISCVALLASARVLSRELELPFRMTALAFFAFVPAIICIGEGQDSVILLLILALTYSLLRKNRDELAGIVLATGLFKPQVVCVVAAAIILSRRWRFLLSFVAGAVLIIGAYTAYMGRGWVAELVQLIRWQESRESSTWMVSLHGLLSFAITTHEHVIAIALTVLLLLASAVVWSRCRNLDVAFGSAVLVGTLAAFHFHIYDVTAYLLPIAILVKLGTSEWDRYALVVFFVSPLVIFLMAMHFTSALAAAAIVFLCTYWRHQRQQFLPHKLGEQ
jgi:hypothetical protein